MSPWIEFIPETEKKYEGIETDMYAYALAAGKLHLKHILNHDWQTTCMKGMDPPKDDTSYKNDVFIHYCAVITSFLDVAPISPILLAARKCDYLKSGNKMYTGIHFLCVFDYFGVYTLFPFWRYSVSHHL